MFFPSVVWFTTDFQISRLEDRDHVRIFLIVMYYEVFSYFFPSTNCEFLARNYRILS